MRLRTKKICLNIFSLAKNDRFSCQILCCKLLKLVIGLVIPEVNGVVSKK